MTWTIQHARPRTASKASSCELQAAFLEHLLETERHVERVRHELTELGDQTAGQLCHPVAAMIDLGDGISKSHADRKTIHALLVRASQRVAHCEIACDITSHGSRPGSAAHVCRRGSTRHWTRKSALRAQVRRMSCS